MKRSEMVRIIEDAIDDSYDYDPDFGQTISAGGILRAIEEAGMLPPDEVEHDDDCPTYDGDECHGCVPRQLTRWEPEDET